MKSIYRLKTTISVLLTVIMVLGMVPIMPTVHAASNTWNPSGGVYDISTEADLFAFKDSLDNNEYYENIEVNLLNDIVVSEGHTYISPSSNVNDAQFCGTFNGNNHTISNLNMVTSDNSTVSFLPFLGDATIKDLTLENVTIENGYSWNAAFAPVSLGDDKIINCHLTGNSVIKTKSDLSKNWNYSAGIIADKYMGSKLEIRDCSVGENVIIYPESANVGREVAAGILAYARDNTANMEIDITNCVNRAQVKANYRAGGIVADVTTPKSRNIYLLVQNCVNYGDIYATNTGTTEQSAAGILASSFPYSAVYIDGCINHGDITVYGTSVDASGGIVGYTNWCSIQNTYNTGTVTASNTNCLGGIVGQIRTNTTGVPHYAGGTDIIYFPEQFNSVINCYNTGDVIGGTSNYIGGICGIIQDADTDASHSYIENAYNFGAVTGTGILGSAVGSIENSKLNKVYAPQGTVCIKDQTTSSGVTGDYTSNIGYYDTPEKSGKIYPATISPQESESISSTPLSTNLLQTLNSYVDTKNAELEGDKNNYRYLTWKMTNPASEDGSKGVTVHPMFGVEELKTLKFHVNEPNKADKLFRVYNGDASEAEDTTEYTLTNGKVEAFYDIPAFAEDDYVFAGWYYNSSDGTSDGNTAFDFDTAVPANVTDVYAHWIPVGEVNKAEGDDKELPSGMNNKYSGFELFGVQIRPEAQFDENKGEYWYGGLRFVTSISESLLSDIDDLSDKTVNGNKVEYGFVTAAESTIDTVADTDYMGIDKSKYKLQYKGENVNGVDTLLDNKTADERKTPDNFRYVTNVDCTSKQGGYGNNAKIKIDHQNFNDYRLATYVVTYEDDPSGANKAKNVVARAYMRYYDANGLLRTFYNDYGGTSVYGGCSTNYNDALSYIKKSKTAVME